MVEGIADAWRLGPGAVATFGIKYTPQQITALKSFKRVSLLYDTDDEAMKQANKLAYALAPFCTVEILGLFEGDPADLPQSEADKLMRSLGIKKHFNNSA